MKLTYAVIMQEGSNNWGAYVPDVQGCGSTGESLDEQRSRIKEALEGHLDDWEKTRLPFPWPKCKTPEEALAADAAFAPNSRPNTPMTPRTRKKDGLPPSLK